MAQFKATTKAGKVQEIRELIETRQDAVERVLVLIYNRQTASEQTAEVTAESNGIGFSGAHAEFGSKLAKYILAGKHLTPKQLPYGRKIARKYAGQILKITEGA